MRNLILLTTGLLAITPVAQADVVDHTIDAKVAGRCEQLEIVGVRKPCAPDSVRFRWTTRGASVRVSLPDAQEFVFMARSDGSGRQPKPGDYRLILASAFYYGDTGAKIGNVPLFGPVGDTHDVTGECRILMSPDGAVWHRLECHARDAANARYSLVLTGGGRMTFLNRGQLVDPPYMPDAPRR